MDVETLLATLETAPHLEAPVEWAGELEMRVDEWAAAVELEAGFSRGPTASDLARHFRAWMAGQGKIPPPLDRWNWPRQLRRLGLRKMKTAVRGKSIRVYLMDRICAREMWGWVAANPAPAEILPEFSFQAVHPKMTAAHKKRLRLARKQAEARRQALSGRRRVYATRKKKREAEKRRAAQAQQTQPAPQGPQTGEKHEPS